MFVSRARDADITIMNEAGLDPGIDHMLAMQCIDQVREHGGKVVINYLFYICTYSYLGDIVCELLWRSTCTGIVQ
jgi:hypothetical protein